MMISDEDKKNVYTDLVQQRVGWVYNNLRKILDSEIIKATATRKKYFDFFAHTIRYAQENRCKPYLNYLSPGCLACIKGTWSCLYINAKCTTDCFFCVQERTTKESLPEEDGHIFTSAAAFVNYARALGFEGVSFTGGEPFLVFDRLVEYIRALRTAFGSHLYLWIYTNGALVIEKKLKVLQKLGLNELRFNIAAQKYSLQSVKLAVKYIDTVTVEIPVIPEDASKVIALLKGMEESKVTFLNLHQLTMNRYNYTALQKYTILHNVSADLLPILESEFAAFEILKKAVQQKSQLGINYCSLCYKKRFQESARLRRLARLCLGKHEIITPSGYIKHVYKDNVSYYIPTLQPDKGIPIPGTDLYVKKLLYKTIPCTDTTLFKSVCNANEPPRKENAAFYQKFADLEYIPQELPEYF